MNRQAYIYLFTQGTNCQVNGYWQAAYMQLKKVLHILQKYMFISSIKYQNSMIEKLFLNDKFIKNNFLKSPKINNSFAITSIFNFYVNISYLYK